jgi:hypothetical protein
MENQERAETANSPGKMKRYRGWPEYPLFLSDCQKAAATDVLVTPPVAAAILSYSRVRMTRLLDQEDILCWAWFEPNKFHASEIFVSVRSLVLFGLRRKRLGSYETELPLQAVIDQPGYEQMRQENTL